MSSASTSTAKWAWLLFPVGLLCGTANSIISKVQFDMVSEGLDGRVAKFEKPWFGTFVMFLAMSFSMVLWFAEQAFRSHIAKSRSRSASLEGADAALMSSSSSSSVTSKLNFKDCLYVMIPAVFDLTGTTLGRTGLLFTTASVSQMLRGSILIFSAFLSVTYLKKSLSRSQWFGLSISTLALIMVGMASLFAHKDSETSHLQMLGISFVLIGQFVGALQFVVEEKLLKEVHTPPLVVVGMEGVWGSLLMLFVFFPIIYLIPGSDAGSYENTLDTLAMLKNNGHLVSTMVLYWFGVMLLNVCGIFVTKVFNAIARTILDIMRTLCVWAASVMLYSLTHGKFGEKWNNWSWLQLAGFALLVLGTSIYNGTVKLRFLEPNLLTIEDISPLASPTPAHDVETGKNGDGYKMLKNEGDIQLSPNTNRRQK